MPYGISAYGQSPQIGSPLQHSGSLIQHMGSGTTTIYAGSESNGSPAAAAVVSSTALQTTSSQSTSSLFRTGDEKRLTREAMERYLRDRNDMIIVVLHAKVIKWAAVGGSHYSSMHFHNWFREQLSTISSIFRVIFRLILFNYHQDSDNLQKCSRVTEREKMFRLSFHINKVLKWNFSINYVENFPDGFSFFHE